MVRSEANLEIDQRIHDAAYAEGRQSSQREYEPVIDDVFEIAEAAADSFNVSTLRAALAQIVERLGQ